MKLKHGSWVLQSGSNNEVTMGVELKGKEA